MAECLRSVGLDIGTTSTQMILSELTVENKASGFSVPELEISGRKILYKSPVYFTPLLEESRMDAEALRELVAREYRAAGIRREDVDTGAIIITGESSRRENARSVLQALSCFAGDFVVAAAGPDLESVLAAKGAGAVAYSRETCKTVLHMDIGGGTSNLALIREGKILRTGCLNVGGRLVKLDSSGKITYVSPVLQGLSNVQVGETVTRERLKQIALLLTRGLEMAAGLRMPTQLLKQLQTLEAESDWEPPEEGCVLSFSGGVADCIDSNAAWLQYGDLGPLLGQAIRESGLCRGAYRLGSETIRATVIGAGCHSAQLSGSTVFCRNVKLPVKNLPVVSMTGEDPLCAQALVRKLQQQEEQAVIALSGAGQGDYEALACLADTILAGVGERPLYLCLEQDMAKALGQLLALRTPEERSILCIDRVCLPEGSFLDVGAPIGPALPVVVKTLVLER